MIDTKLNPELKRIALKLLPSFLVDSLDPVTRIIEKEVEWVADLSRDGHIILDAGAGEARHRAHFRRGRYIALDSGVGDPGWDYTRLDICGNLQRLPLRDASMDAVLCMVVLEHTRKPGEVLKEFARVLKPGGICTLVLPFLWEEHQVPHDYFRFTRYGIRSLLEELPFKVELLEPMGGFFRVCSRRCFNLLGLFQGGWRWLVFAALAPFFGFLFPLMLHFMDPLDGLKNFTLGFRVRLIRQ